MSFPTIDLPARDARQGEVRTRSVPAIFSRTRHAVAVRIALGLALAAGALALPWLGLTLSPSLSAWRLSLSVGALPLLHHVTYGMILAVLTLGATVSFVRAKGHATRSTRAIGWAYLALSLTFFVTTRLSGTATMFALQSDANQAQIINSQFLTNNNVPPPSQFLGISFDPKTLLLLLALRLGWYLTLAAGILLAGRIERPATFTLWIAPALAALAVLTVIAGLCLAAVAQGDLNDGVQAVATGQAATGERLIDSALRLNPQIAYDPGLQQALGQAQADQGRQTGLADYAEAVRPVGRDLSQLQKAQLFSQALASLPTGSPAAAVVRADLAIFLANSTIASGNPNLLVLVNGQLPSPAVSFSVGHYYYEAGADARAIDTLDMTRQETNNFEVQSLALTYIALSWLRLGNERNFRSNIVAAVRDDRLDENVYAREIAAGLYVPGTP